MANISERAYKAISRTAAVIGILFILLPIGAEWIGIGSPGFGFYQIVFTAAGIFLSLSGLFLFMGITRSLAVRCLTSGAMLFVVSLSFGIFAAEFGLMLRERYFPDALNVAMHPEPDERLGFRIPPFASGHDAKGFRNDLVPEHPHVVAIGDSQTWGVNASKSEAWPQALGRISNLNVYNMSLGGYGPIQYEVLTEEALQLKPSTIVLGLYFGNDLYDAYSMVYHGSRYAFLQSPHASPDWGIDTIAPKAGVLNREEDETQRKMHESSIMGRLSDHSAIIRQLIRIPILGALTDNTSQIANAWAKSSPAHGAIFESESTNTVFTQAARLMAVDLDEPRIAEGLRITEEVIVRAKSRTQENGAKLIVLMIPTKESVYADPAHANMFGETFARLVQMESLARDEVKRTCFLHGIQCVDALPVLQRAIKNGERIYPPNSDGHPNAKGYSLLASVVHDEMDKPSGLESPSSARD